ncbi:GDT1-like protein [Ceratobasidium sp. AG-Ba]|nr:GDT1-like protein [Ceratobasidium sp. AG-Ba]
MAPIPAVPSDDNVHALSSAFLMIIASEIGDKTFLIAAIMAMRHPRLIVFSGAFGSLIVMSALSAAMGHLLPTLISRRWTTLAAAGLFLVFGVKMLLEAREMEAGHDKIQEELKEVEEELDAAEGSIPMRHMEQGKFMFGHDNPLTVLAHPICRRTARTRRGAAYSSTKNASLSEGAKNLFGMCLGPTFILTFLGEWGDRSQIATIALGAAHNFSVALAFDQDIDQARHSYRLDIIPAFRRGILLRVVDLCSRCTFPGLGYAYEGCRKDMTKPNGHAA